MPIGCTNLCNTHVVTHLCQTREVKQPGGLQQRALVPLTYRVQLGMVWVRASAVSQASNLTPGCAPIRQKRINRQMPKLAAALPQCTIRNTYRSV